MFTEPVQSRAAKREATRQKVLAAAERLFHEQGFGATTVRQIAAEAAVSTGTVMSVGDKEALLVAIFDHWIDDVHRARSATGAGTDTGAPAAGPPAPGDPVEAAMALFEPFIRYFAQDRELSREYAAVIVRGQRESVIFQNLALSLITEIEAVLTPPGRPAADAGPGARVVYFAYLGLLMTFANGALDEHDARDRLREVIEFAIAREGEER
ncbi:TetR/AcrR family transcriptional regulator [Streptomyces sp. NPDC046203]|uniref:TetR/AcrR family transcriptional regulator n=1 Tax=Streptomyces sp. NPDC046203 TaxID=3154602 RepID=UPI0033E3B42A